MNAGSFGAGACAGAGAGCKLKSEAAEVSACPFWAGRLIAGGAGAGGGAGVGATKAQAAGTSAKRSDAEEGAAGIGAAC